MEEVIEERKFIIYRKILYMIDNFRIVDEDSSGITTEIDLLQHYKLLDDLVRCKIFCLEV